MSPAELRGPADALLDAPLTAFETRGLGTVARWRARVVDDDQRRWRAEGASLDTLVWRGPGAVAALRSLRPVALDLRAEGQDGGAAARTVTRRVLAEGVLVRRWKAADLAATMYRPASFAASVLVGAGPPDASRVNEDRRVRTSLSLDDPGGDAAAAALPVACALLASRGVLVVAVERGTGQARDLLAAVPGAGDPQRRTALPLPPGIPAAVPVDAVAWDELLRALGARPRA